jgi:hypothetical protein
LIFSLAVFLLVTRKTAFPFSATVWRQIEAVANWNSSSGFVMKFDPLFGRMLAPNQTQTVRAFDFTYTFSIDENGRRVVPAPAAANLPKVVFLGSSWTFGIPLNDEQAFPYRVAAQLSRSFEVWNEGYVSFTFQKSVRRLQQIVEAEDRENIDSIFLEWLPTATAHLRNPNFVFPDNLEMRERIRRSHSTIEQNVLVARDLCSSKHIQFVMLLFSRDAAGWIVPTGDFDRMKRFLETNGITYLDLSVIRDDANPYVHDAHPGPRWHEHAAQMIVTFIKAAHTRQ